MCRDAVSGVAVSSAQTERHVSLRNGSFHRGEKRTVHSTSSVPWEGNVPLWDDTVHVKMGVRGQSFGRSVKILSENEDEICNWY